MDISERFAANLVEASLMEGGSRLPRFETLVKLVGALEVSPEVSDQE